MKQDKLYTGIIVPAVTPLTAQMQVDVSAVNRLFEMFYSHEAAPFILGTTGEAASLSMPLKRDYILAAEQSKKKDTVLYAGISSNVLEECLEIASFGAAHSVDVLVATLPGYYELTPAQMLHYFSQLADQLPLPLFIYNIPATTHMSLPLPVIDQLSRHPNIVGLKDSERNETRMLEALKLWKDRSDFHYLLGWAAKSAHALIRGADGLVPSTGNLYPEIYQQMIRAFKDDDLDMVYKMQELSDTSGATYQKDRTLAESLRSLKLLMSEKGICESHVMSPL